MYPCNINNPIDFKTGLVTPLILSFGHCEATCETRQDALRNAAISRICVLCTAFKSAAISRISVLCA